MWTFAFEAPVEIAIAVATAVVLVMAIAAFTLPRLYHDWFVPVLWIAFGIAVGGGAYCWGVSNGIVDAFTISQDLSVAVKIDELATSWRRSGLWFSLGFFVFGGLHILFGQIARWVWLTARRKRQDKVEPSEVEAPQDNPPRLAASLALDLMKDAPNMTDDTAAAVAWQALAARETPSDESRYKGPAPVADVLSDMLEIREGRAGRIEQDPVFLQEARDMIARQAG
jgi:hypothetical protein